MAFFTYHAANMSQHTDNHKYTLLKSLAICALAVLLSFLWQGHKGFSLWDEGFLWYGVQRVLLGEVPLLDFMAYDPGRYYWSAAWLGMVGDHGIISLRAVVAVFQGLGLVAGLLLIAQSEKSVTKDRILFWVASVAILLVWMFPRHKLFDISLSIFLVAALAYLVKCPQPRRYFITGISVGLIAVFGRNHGVYGAAASLGVMAWIAMRNTFGPGFIKGGVLWGAGVALGFLPMILMAALIPGFAEAFWESIRFLFEYKATNLPLPIPWPWTVRFADISADDAARGVLIGLFFIATLVFGVSALGWVIYRGLRKKEVSPAFVAAAFLALPYAHFAFSRADVGHLAQGIFPMLIGCLMAISACPARIKWLLVIALGVASYGVMMVFHPGWQCRKSEQCTDVIVAGHHLQVDHGTASDIALLRQLSEEFAPAGQSFLATPLWPGAYALLERPSPMWEIYALFPRSHAFQEKEIARIQAAKPGFVLIFDLALDGREELRFKNTHPLIHDYILAHFEPLALSANPAYHLYKARSEGQ